MLPPTSQLPPIVKIFASSVDEIWSALHFLRFVYCPEVRGSRCRTLGRLHTHDRADRLKPTIHADAGRHDNLHLPSDVDLQLLRSDAFERSYAIKWLTALVSQADAVESDPSKVEGTPLSPQQREAMMQEAALLLAICAGAASAGTLTRVFTFPTSNGQSDIRVQLTDAPLENHNFASVGAQTWGSACVLAERIVQCPEQFGLVGHHTIGNSFHSNLHKIDAELRVIELGAGTGLVSITLAKLLESPGDWTSQPTMIVATDFYPSVLANLQNNIISNFATVDSGDSQPAVSILSHFLDWSTFSVAAQDLVSPLDQPFDLILGADIVYEAEHAFWIKQCLNRLLRKSRHIEDDQGGIFHLVIPLRPTHTTESSTINKVFPRREDIHVTGQHHCSMELGILSQEMVVCDAQGDGGDEVEYAYYQIGWC